MGLLNPSVTDKPLDPFVLHLTTRACRSSCTSTTSTSSRWCADMPSAVAVVWCLAIATLYVGSFYIIPGLPPSRQHPTTVKARMLSTFLTSTVAWLPAWHTHRQLQLAHTPTAQPEKRAALSNAPHQPLQDLPPLPQLLGIDCRMQQLVPALAKGIGLTLLLFLGPLLHKATSHQHGNAKKLPLHMVRDYVWSPIAEEWCFRACMVPLMWMQGHQWRTLIFMTPLFFGMCHLHHCWSVVRMHGFLPRAAAAQTLLQFLYTTVFGAYATWLFTATGSIVAAMAVHSFCNVMGLPPFGQMDRSSICCSILGLVLFYLTAPRVLQPAGDVFWWQRCCLHLAGDLVT